MPYTSSRVQRRSRASSAAVLRSKLPSSSAPARRSAQIAAAAIRASVTPACWVEVTGRPSVVAIGGKIVVRGLLGIRRIPDSANDRYAVCTGFEERRRVLHTHAADGNDGKRRRSSERSHPLHAARKLQTVREGGEHMSGHEPVSAGGFG